MGMTAVENGQVQRMERRVTGERSLVLRLLLTLILGWPPLCAGEASSQSPGITTVSCRSLASSCNTGDAESTIDLQIAHLHQMHLGTGGLPRSRSLAAIIGEMISSWTKIWSRWWSSFTRQKTSRSLCGSLVHAKP